MRFSRNKNNVRKINVVRNILANKSLVPCFKHMSAFSPSNIALCKYWGKRNPELNLPVTSSLSISLGSKGAYTKIGLCDNQDQIILNGIMLEKHDIFFKRLRDFLDLFRFNKNMFYCVETILNIPVAAGVASSACGFSALVQALDKFYSWQLDEKSLSILARLGSGSASRSLWHGFVEWHKGEREDGMDSYAEPLHHDWSELCVGLLIIAESQKLISSREAMQITVETSPLYADWPQRVDSDLRTLKQTIERHDFLRFGAVSESNAMGMHAIMKTASPAIIYATKKTEHAIQKVWALRKNGLSVFFTQDAGANIKLLFLEKDKKIIQQEFPTLEIIKPFDDNEQVILVDEHDNEVGVAEKIKVHQEALLHRAFSVFIYRKNKDGIEILLQQRQQDKYHSGGLWTNTCCSHPRPGELTKVAAERRLKEEMGISAELDYVGQFKYVAKFDNGLTEHELDHVFIGEANGNICVNQREVENYRWISWSVLGTELATNPQQYTPWFTQALAIMKSGLSLN